VLLAQVPAGRGHHAALQTLAWLAAAEAFATRRCDSAHPAQTLPLNLDLSSSPLDRSTHIYDALVLSVDDAGVIQGQARLARSRFCDFFSPHKARGSMREVIVSDRERDSHTGELRCYRRDP